jgi:hypothetical protein
MWINPNLPTNLTWRPRPADTSVHHSVRTRRTTPPADKNHVLTRPMGKVFSSGGGFSVLRTEKSAILSDSNSRTQNRIFLTHAVLLSNIHRYGGLLLVVWCFSSCLERCQCKKEICTSRHLRRNREQVSPSLPDIIQFLTNHTHTHFSVFHHDSAYDLQKSLNCPLFIKFDLI